MPQTDTATPQTLAQSICFSPGETDAEQLLVCVGVRCRTARCPTGERGGGSCAWPHLVPFFIFARKNKYLYNYNKYDLYI